MRINSLSIPALSVLIFFLTSLATSTPTSRTSCDSEKRVALTRLAFDNINYPTLFQTIKAYKEYPFSADMSVILNPDDVGDLRLTSDRTSTIAFLAAAYNALQDFRFYSFVVLNETTVFFNITANVGVAHLLPLPVELYFDAYATFQLEKCELREVHAYADVPDKVLGIGFDITLGFP